MSRKKFTGQIFFEDSVRLMFLNKINIAMNQKKEERMNCKCGIVYEKKPIKEYRQHPAYVTPQNLLSYSYISQTRAFGKSENLKRSVFQSYPSQQKNHSSFNNGKNDEYPKKDEENLKLLLKGQKLKTLNDDDQLASQDDQLKVIERRILQLEKRMKDAEKSISGSMKENKLDQQASEKQQKNSVEELRVLVEESVRKMMRPEDQDLRKCEETIEELKDLLAEEPKIQFEDTSNSENDYLKEIQHYCRNMVEESEEDLKTFLESKIETFKKEISQSMRLLNKRYESLTKPHKSEYFGSILPIKKEWVPSHQPDQKTIYLVDREGNLLDSSGFHLVDNQGQNIQLTQSQIQRLNQSSILTQP